MEAPRRWIPYDAIPFEQKLVIGFPVPALVLQDSAHGLSGCERRLSEGRLGWCVLYSSVTDWNLEREPRRPILLAALAILSRSRYQSENQFALERAAYMLLILM